VCYVKDMKEITLREANQQFSQLVRDVEETGEGIRVLRNGKPAVEIVPSRTKKAARRLTAQQEKAFDAFLRAARENPGDSTGEPRWTRDELHER
jgi:prevent-host-death family protein